MTHRNDLILSTAVRLGSSSTPRFSTQQVFTASGYRKANQLWAEPLRRLNLQYHRPIADAAEIRRVFLALAGPRDTFLARDWADWHTGADEDMSAGGSAGVTMLDAPLINPNSGDNLADGSTTVFRCYKSYRGGSASSILRIRHPAAASLLVAVDGADASGQVSEIDEAAGEVTFSSAPPFGASPSGVPVTWGGEFYRAVHFVEDDLEQVLQNLKADSFNFPLQEAKGV